MNPKIYIDASNMTTRHATERGQRTAEALIAGLVEDAGISESEAAQSLLDKWDDANRGPYDSEYAAWCDAVRSTLAKAINDE